ncbi:hypothetical protein JCM3765_007605 [Sporobolomyces pararoseus]
MDIDEIFKTPPLPKTSTSSSTSTSNNKRKHLSEPSFDPESYKSIKLSSDQSPSSVGGGVTIQDEEDDDDEFAPNGDADYFKEEDEDGRFFGGGLSSVQKQVLNIMDHDPNNNTISDTTGKGEGAQELTTPNGIKKQLLGFEKIVNKNRDQRTKFPNQPEKFVDSEFNLIESIHSLMILSSTPTISYNLLIENSTLSTMADLLSHENVEVSIAVIQVLEEYLDPEGLEENDDDEDDEEEDEKRRKSIQRLIDELVQVGILDLIVGGLKRFDEQDEDHRTGVFHTLNLIENLLTLSPSLASLLLTPKSQFISYLFNRLLMNDKPPEFDQNRFYSCEMLSLIWSLPLELIGGNGTDGGGGELLKKSRMRLVAEKKGEWLDGLLSILSVYRKREPSSADETEFLENLFDILCVCLSSPLPTTINNSLAVSTRHPVKIGFLNSEGIELMLLLLKSSHQISKTRSLKCLAHALQGLREGNQELSERFVECLGLKTLFSVFMGKGNGKKKSTNLTSETLEHLLSILSSLFTSLPSDSQPRLRLLSKFIEENYSKLDRLSELREQLEQRLERLSETPNSSIAGLELTEEEKYLEKLENGLMSLQFLDYVAGWICMEDDGARDHFEMLLKRRDKSLKDLVVTLKEYRDNINIEELGGEGQEDLSEREPSEAEVQKGILGNLVEWLESVA